MNASVPSSRPVNVTTAAIIAALATLTGIVGLAFVDAPWFGLILFLSALVAYGLWKMQRWTGRVSLVTAAASVASILFIGITASLAGEQAQTAAVTLLLASTATLAGSAVAWATARHNAALLN